MISVEDAIREITSAAFFTRPESNIFNITVTDERLRQKQNTFDSTVNLIRNQLSNLMVRAEREFDLPSKTLDINMFHSPGDHCLYIQLPLDWKKAYDKLYIKREL